MIFFLCFRHIIVIIHFVRDYSYLLFNRLIAYLIKVVKCINEVAAWRNGNGLGDGTPQTVVDYYNYLREVCSVVQSHDDGLIGGLNKTVQIDETFLTRRKYNRGMLK